MRKKINARNVIREFPLKEVLRDKGIKELANRLKLKPHQLKNLLDKKLKPGIKIMGKRFFSNVDTMAGYLNEVGIKNYKNTPRQSVKPIYDPTMNVYGITDAQKLKYLFKVHGIHPSVIKDALKAGAPPKSLIKTMMSETIPSETISKWFRHKSGEKWQESNERKRSAKDIKNKITKGPLTTEARSNFLYEYQKQFGTKHGLVPQETIKELLKKGYKFDSLKSQLKVRKQPPTDWHPKVIDKGFQETLGLLDEKGNPTAKNKISSGPNAKWKPMRSFKDLSIDAFNTGKPTTKLSGDNLKLWNAYASHQNDEWRKWKRRTRETNRNRIERIDAGRAKQARMKQVRGGLMNTAAWIVADVLGERVIDPLTKKLVEKTIGPQLIKIREQNDKRRKRK